jgi:hypothetical protein
VTRLASPSAEHPAGEVGALTNIRCISAGRPVKVTLMFTSAVIGSIPRMGKTFLPRLLALIAAWTRAPRCHGLRTRPASRAKQRRRSRVPAHELYLGCRSRQSRLYLRVKPV